MASKPKPPKKSPVKKKTREAKAPDVPASSDLQKLLHLNHGDPHSFLGIHAAPQGAVIRVFRPGALEVRVSIGKLKWEKLEKVDASGLYEKLFEGLSKLEPYEV